MSLRDEDVQQCDTYLKTSQRPVMIPYPRDPLKKKYGGMPVADFLREVQSVATRDSSCMQLTLLSGAELAILDV